MPVDAIVEHITGWIAASGALGTAASGLVDATKVFCGGISNVGFRTIKCAVSPLLPAGSGVKLFKPVDVVDTLRSNWINGVAMVDQKVKAKAVIRLCLTDVTAASVGLDVGLPELAGVVKKIASWGTLTDTDKLVLARFDDILMAILDRAYEQADQQYRNCAKALAAIFAIVLAVIASYLLYPSQKPSDWTLWVPVLAGVVAIPLAPIVKDLSSALAAAVKGLAGAVAKP